MIEVKKVFMVIALRYKHNGILSFWDSREGAESQVVYNNKMRGNKYDHDIREIDVPEDAKYIYTIEKNCKSENAKDYRYEIIHDENFMVTMTIEDIVTKEIDKHAIFSGTIDD